MGSGASKAFPAVRDPAKSPVIISPKSAASLRPSSRGRPMNAKWMAKLVKTPWTKTLFGWLYVLSWGLG
jgi:hypothetical protein